MFNRFKQGLFRRKSTDEPAEQEQESPSAQQEEIPSAPKGSAVTAPPAPAAPKTPPPAAPKHPSPAAGQRPAPAISKTPPPAAVTKTPPAPTASMAPPSAAPKTAPAGSPKAPEAASKTSPTARPAAPPSPMPAPTRAATPPSAPPASQAAVEVDDWDEDEPEADEPARERSGKGGSRLFRNPFSQSLSRTRQMFGKVSEAFQRGKIDDQLWDDLEETLITSDIGVAITERLIATLKERIEYAGLKDARDVRDALEEELLVLLGDPEPLNFSKNGPLTAILVVGVNGVGKTTTIAKLTAYLRKQGHRVILAAGDTFRAAAIDQLKIWGERVKVPVISHQHGADPGAVVFDAVDAAENRRCDVLIIDTAGRLHTKYNLMEELKKITKVLGKKDPTAPHEVLLVVDATTGQNALIQAKQFVGDIGLTGLVLTKLDGTARGGMVFSISEELGLPIKFIGTGERLGDLAPFDPEAFVQALFSSDGA